MQYNEFPKFVPDQLLMSDHLNQVFNYLDEQERVTRTCLIGVGIVCGLEVKTNANGTAITITAGCGITTEGYLIQVPEMTYTERVDYDPVKERYYDRFVNLTTKKKKFDLFELVQSGVVEESVLLTDAFISEKVVMLFVELLEEQSKNCDPNSCDNKGVEVTVTFRPLLVAKADAAALKTVAGAGTNLNGDLWKLPEMRMPRVDVPATSLVDSTAVFEAFLAPFTEKFLEKVEKTLSKTYTLLRDLVVDAYPSDPFKNLAKNFNFLLTQNMTMAQLLHTQYYYDLFSDILLSYDELRRAGGCLAGVCCPDDDFPRHLLLGEAKGYSPYIHSDYRHYFIPSPILAKQPCALAELRSLEIRLALLVTRFLVPDAKKQDGKLPPEFIGITPSTLGDVPLSRKAIPFYYAVTKTPNPLYTYWDPAKTRANMANRNLSYNASEYSSDEMIVKPLLYDLEPYNFLRIEGHVGQSFSDSLSSIQLQRKKYRLPIEVIALSTDTQGLLAELTGTSAKDVSTVARAGCQFRDLESLYAALERQLICFLAKEMEYYYALPNSAATPGVATLAPSVSLLQKYDSAFRYGANTYGEAFEAWFAPMQKMPYAPTESILATSGYSSYVQKLFQIKESEAKVARAAAAPTVTKTPISVSEVQRAVTNQFILYIPYYIELLSETLTGSLATLDFDTFKARFENLQKMATIYERIVVQDASTVTFATEELLSHLEKLIYACFVSEIESLVAEFEKRWRAIEALRRLAYYAKKCPGIQHKAGVPMGGTFILVYHEIASKRVPLIEIKKLSVTDKTLEELIPEVQVSKTKIDKLIPEIPDGTVIADFYLPFICCSDCPPIHFEVAAPEAAPGTPDAPKMSIDPTEFCNGDPGPIAITVSPTGGTISGEGVTDSSFVPQDVAVGGNSVKEVELTYTFGDATVSQTVKVYHSPIPKFKIVQNADAGPAHVQIVDSSKFAASYSWDFGDGTAAVTTQQASHDYTASGTYKITLTATNGKCTVDKSAEVTIELPRLCIPIKLLGDEFKKLSSFDTAARFKTFTSQYAPYKEIAAFLSKLVKLSAADELKFYSDNKLDSLLVKWLGLLEDVILKGEVTQTLGIELYRILLDLAMRVACFQDQDIDAAKVPMARVLEMAAGAVSQWKQIAQSVPPAKDRINALLGDVEQESDRLKAGEKSDKPIYGSALLRLIQVLQATLL
jgi:hypothetical protein